METDADRLASIKGAGGQLVTHAAGDFWAIFDKAYAAASVGGLDVESTGPAFTCRSSDVAKLAKDEVLTVGETNYRLKRPQSEDPAPGWTVLLLK